jgi:hypothetical protein
MERSSMTRLSPDQEHSKQRLQRATPPVPAEAVASVKADVEEIKERTHR